VSNTAQFSLALHYPQLNRCGIAWFATLRPGRARPETTRPGKRVLTSSVYSAYSQYRKYLTGSNWLPGYCLRKLTQKATKAMRLVVGQSLSECTTITYALHLFDPSLNPWRIHGPFLVSALPMMRGRPILHRRALAVSRAVVDRSGCQIGPGVTLGCPCFMAPGPVIGQGGLLACAGLSLYHECYASASAWSSESGAVRVVFFFFFFFPEKKKVSASLSDARPLAKKSPRLAA